ncbi:MAG TPA: c-type cytochrome [Phenylobacterium sp.]|jgi:cytochrome c
MKRLMAAACAVGLIAAAPAPAGDARRGETLYAACAACHALDAGQNQLGPHLKGVVGRKAAAVEDYNYSGPMRRAEVTWTPETLDAFLADPQAVVAGTKMPFSGMAGAKDRADLIAYLAAAATPAP